jgi:hypothetical protein
VSGDRGFESALWNSIESITMNAGAIQAGRALAPNGAVRMGSTIIGIPEPAIPMLFSGALIYLGFRRRKPASSALCGRSARLDAVVTPQCRFHRE